MPATYSFICIPLDTRDPAGSRNSFELKLVSQLQFPMGMTHPPAAIREALAQHPILAPQTVSIRCLVWDLRSWRANGNAMNPTAATRVALDYAGDDSRAMLLATLTNYLAGSNRPLPAEALDHDRRFDNLDTDDFVDVAKVADDLKMLTQSLQFAAVSGLRRVTAASEGTPVFGLGSVESMSFGLSRWLNAATQAALLDALSTADDEGTQRRRLAVASLAPALRDVREPLRKINRRITVDPAAAVTANKTTTLLGVRAAGGTRVVNPADLNVAIQSALKNSLLARSCGFVTSWKVTSPIALAGADDLVIQLDADSLTYDRSIVGVEPSQPTAFRRDTHTHPLSFADVGTPASTNGAFACLNDGSGTARYRASCVNTEGGVVKQIVVQASNSLAGPAPRREDAFGAFNEPLDDRPPQALGQQQFGIPEPETSGVVFSAPVEDLVTPRDLRFDTPEARRAALPCLFHEDLWIGYRLDLRRVGGTFTSVHRQRQDIQFSAGRRGVTGTTEDYLDREQADDPKRGHSSTELITYKGFSTGQADDYLKFLELKKQAIAGPQQPFQATVTGYEAATRLSFGQEYEYRLRTVFLGAVSCDAADKALMDDLRYRQQFPFYRARAFRPGEMLSSSSDTEDPGDEQGRTIYLTRQKRRVTVTFVPSPIDLDTSRFHGTLFADKSEILKHANRKHVADLGKFFATLPPAELNYFYDPDVYGLVVRVTMVNGDPRAIPEDFVYVDGSYCLLSKHVALEPIAESYGPKGEWERFRPIVMTFRTSDERLPRLRRRGRWRGARRLELSVPPAAELHVSVVPLIERDLLRKTASHAASNFQLSVFGAFLPLDMITVPAVAEQAIKVIHAVEQPAREPRLLCEPPRVSPHVASPTDAPAVASRQSDSELAEIVGRVEVDAASTKEVRLEANWRDVADEPGQPRYALESGSASATPRSVVFQAFEPVRPSAQNFHRMVAPGSESPSPHAAHERQLSLPDQFNRQCAEDKVFLGVTPVGERSTAAGKTNSFDLKDHRRKLLSVEAVALSRFAGRFGGTVAASERRSDPVIVDVPGTLRMTAPIMSHVVPLRRAQATGSDRAGNVITTFGVRVYLRRPWFESGVGERLAIGCAVGEEAPVAGAQEVPKHITQWGEDPVERAALRSTRRMPLASDFMSCDQEPSPEAYPDDVYPPYAIGGNSPIIYRDNVSVLPNGPGSVRRRLSVASFAVRYDPRQRLWYADIYVQGDFFGWCGLALYRHQPHALPDRELSEAWHWVYAAVLHGEPLAWIERAGNLHFTIGPVYDENVAFEFDSLEYRSGVSGEIAGREQAPLRRYRVGKALYFEGVLPKESFDWGLLKKRFGHAVASRRLRRD